MRPADRTGLCPFDAMGATAEELTVWQQHMSNNKLHTLARLSWDEVSMIWSHVSDFILRQLRLQKGVYLPDFGTFTFMRQKLYVGNRFSFIQIPIFIMSEKLLQLHGLQQTKIHTARDIPVEPLNFITVAIAGHYRRDTVEGCIKETVQLLSQSICTRKKVEFTFQGIGILTIENDKVKMNFFKDFLSATDKSGNLEKGIAKKPQSVNSTLANIKNLKRSPNCVLSFPRIEFKSQQNNETTETSKLRKSVLKMKLDKDDVQANFLPRPPGQKPILASGNIAPVILPITLEPDKTVFTKTRTKSVPHPPNPSKNMKTEPKTSETTTCRDHEKAGQCTKANSALYSHIEKNKEEEEDKQFLHQYQIMRDKDTAFKDQLKKRSSILPVYEPIGDFIIRGKNKNTLEAEKWQRNIQLVQHPVEAAAGDKKESIPSQTNSHQQKKEMTQKHYRAPDKLFILDQCNDYKRCKQCQRDPSNKGKTYFWPYNKHLPGSPMIM